MVLLRVCIVTLAISFGGFPHAAGARVPGNTDEIECLALAIFFEARGEVEIVRRAVAHIVLNRVGDERFPNSICGVVFQRGADGGCQFSWYCDGRSDVPKDVKSWKRAIVLARKVVAGLVPDPTRGALYFHHASVDPAWADEFVELATIGDMIYYKPVVN